jgi:hypothetical protein
MGGHTLSARRSARRGAAPLSSSALGKKGAEREREREREREDRREGGEREKAAAERAPHVGRPRKSPQTQREAGGRCASMFFILLVTFIEKLVTSISKILN